MKVLALVVLAGCADEAHWDLTASAPLPAVVLDDVTPRAAFHVHLAFDGPLVSPDGSLGLTPEIVFLPDRAAATIEFKAELVNDANGFSSWIQYTHMPESAVTGDDIRTFAWRDCEDDCVLDYTIWVSREEPVTATSPRTEISGLVNTYLTDTGNGDLPPEGATITLAITPLASIAGR